MVPRRLVFLSAIFALMSLSAVSQDGEQAPDCSEDIAFTLLDFWIGTWRVVGPSGVIGTNRIQKILDGCAIIEEWTSAEGRRGFSLFYFRPEDRNWQQVWVTDRALGQGGVKEKALVERLPDGGVRFQGKGISPNGRLYVDRTTLRSVNADEIQQVIEISLDDGVSWKTWFQATYQRRAKADGN